MRPLLFIVLVALAPSLHAQDEEKIFRSFKVDLAAGYAAPLGAQMNSSGVFSLEPKYSISNKFTIGLRLENTDVSPNYDFYEDLTSSIGITTDYFINTNRVRPFVGAGINSYSVPTKRNYGFGSSTSSSVSRFSITTRSGVEIGHLRASLELNLISKYLD